MSIIGRWKARRRTRKQIRWAQTYIRDRYGTVAPGSGEASFRWYDVGGPLPPQLAAALHYTDRPEHAAD